MEHRSNSSLDTFWVDNEARLLIPWFSFKNGVRLIAFNKKLVEGPGGGGVGLEQIEFFRVNTTFCGEDVFLDELSRSDFEEIRRIVP